MMHRKFRFPSISNLAIRILYTIGDAMCSFWINGFISVPTGRQCPQHYGYDYFLYGRRNCTAQWGSHNHTSHTKLTGTRQKLSFLPFANVTSKLVREVHVDNFIMSSEKTDERYAEDKVMANCGHRVEMRRDSRSSLVLVEVIVETTTRTILLIELVVKRRFSGKIGRISKRGYF